MEVGSEAESNTSFGDEEAHPEGSSSSDESVGEEAASSASRPVRARGRGGGRRRGRGRGQQRRQLATAQPQQATSYNSYGDADQVNQLPDFAPSRIPGLHLEVPLLRGAMTRAVDFFQLFFTAHLVQQICANTNAYAYAYANIEQKQSYANEMGAWNDTNPEEINRLIALILYCGLVNVSSFHRYWNTKTLYHGLWARAIMARDRFKALMAMLHVVNQIEEDDQDKLRKVRSFLDHFKERCKALYQPFQNVAIDERMVKSKHRSGMRQYIKNKPTKWGLKLWVLADSTNGYTYDFDVYAGRQTANAPSTNGLAYDVVMKLLSPLLNQGYHLYCDNFYTSVTLIKDLFLVKTPATGTAAENRRGFPEEMKNGRKWAGKKERGSMRWHRDGVCLAQQWKDNRPVTILSSIECANDYVIVSRKVKSREQWTNIEVRQPMAINNYNSYMNGVDRSDQLMTKNNALSKCRRWWKVLFFHMIDIAVVNSYILFQLHRAQNPDNTALYRPKKYSVAEFREELVRQLVGLEEFGPPPAHKPPTRAPNQFETVHMPMMSDVKRNCKVCYATTGKELKVRTYCEAPQCQAYLHLTSTQNCFKIWHSKEFHE
ncbi:piggyBac transposable element-derived protein 4-like [Nematostella vectensis]|uniref:piggyBac transposable element-derived protein 4-like n=1 Tax=Nematostella vectensis TaxID=45351 RepID=UPI00207759C2|nr:piggyBac transposable element-derived protein 4-like [Nematostella vectensis]